MANPFPGVDPYIESGGLWEDFHTRLLTACTDRLLARLPDGYDARINENVRFVERRQESDTPYAKRFKPDVAVVTDDYPRGSGDGGGVAVLEVPTATGLRLPELEEVIVRRIEVTRFPDRELVTVIEVLSPANKRGDGYGEYASKRDALLVRGINLVEIDLLVGGKRPRFADPIPPAHYYAFVTRRPKGPPGRRGTPRADVWAWNVGNRVPVIPVPLREPDPDVPLDLRASLHEAYDRGRYERALRPDAAVPEELDADTRGWAAGRHGQRWTPAAG